MTDSGIWYSVVDIPYEKIIRNNIYSLFYVNESIKACKGILSKFNERNISDRFVIIKSGKVYTIYEKVK